MYNGTVQLFGHDLRDLSPESIGGVVASVSQEHFLFPGTIQDNLLLGNKGRSREELESACVKAAILDFINSLPQGFDTPVVGMQGKVSNGQAQRINIAGAFLKNAPVLMLDEPTAALDPQTAEKLVHDVLHEAQDKTVLMILHDLSLAAQFDRTITLREGEIVQ